MLQHYLNQIMGTVMGAKQQYSVYEISVFYGILFFGIYLLALAFML